MNSSLGSLQKPTGWSWWIDDWLVVEPYPSEKKWVKVSWDDDIPNLWKVIKFMFQTTNQYTYPICSMYSIFTYIWAIYGVNDGKYSIHGAYGFLNIFEHLTSPKWNHSAILGKSTLMNVHQTCVSERSFCPATCSSPWPGWLHHNTLVWNMMVHNKHAPTGWHIFRHDQNQINIIFIWILDN